MGSAFKNKGVQPMLDAVIDYLPSPIDVPPMTGHRPGNKDEKIVCAPRLQGAVLGAGVKVAASPSSGTARVRVYSGRVDAGTQVMNSTKLKKERIGKFFQMHANKENPVPDGSAGHIYAIIGLKDRRPATPCAPSRTRWSWSR